ncbi:MAG: hypothetical protein KatS3mg077_3321 [Candidatus Binatia bacterium]|nr:MAG: hypothetical protein KatS3mg077_3321 [Candidatus Binatia bacterium]
MPRHVGATGRSPLHCSLVPFRVRERGPAAGWHKARPEESPVTEPDNGRLHSRPAGVIPLGGANARRRDGPCHAPCPRTLSPPAARRRVSNPPSHPGYKPAATGVARLDGRPERTDAQGPPTPVSPPPGRMEATATRQRDARILPQQLPLAPGNFAPMRVPRRAPSVSYHRAGARWYASCPSGCGPTYDNVVDELESGIGAAWVCL